MEITTSTKLKVIKELLATCFINTNERLVINGIQFRYKSYPYEDKEVKGWKFDVIVKELAYGEHTIQEFRFQRPDNIDPKNMEYHVLTEMFTQLTLGALISWHQLANVLATDKELQEKVTKGDYDEPEINIPAN